MYSTRNKTAARALLPSILAVFALTAGCSDGPGDRDRPGIAPDTGDQVDGGGMGPDGGLADAGPTDDTGPSGDVGPGGGDTADGGETDTGPSGPPGFSLQSKVTAGGQPAEGGGFSLNGHVTTSHSGQVCTGGSWTLEPEPLRARE